MEQFVMFVLWVGFGMWMYSCLHKVGCFRCVMIRYAGLIVTLMLVSALL